MNDQRVQAAEKLFSRASNGEAVLLTDLDDDAEMTLGRIDWAFSAVELVHAWDALSDDERGRRENAARASLLDRDLVAVTGSGADAEAALCPELGMIAIARSAADFSITTLTDPSETPPLAVPIGYALCDERAGLRGIVIEFRGGGTHQYRLANVERASIGFADWMTLAVTTTHWGLKYDRTAAQAMRFDYDHPQALGVEIQPREGAVHGASLLTGGRRRRFDGSDRTRLADEIASMIRDAVEVGSA